VPSARHVQEKLAAGRKLSVDELVNAAVMRLSYLAVNALRDLEPEGALRMGRVVLRLKHKDLLSYLWFQYAHALIARRRFRQCRHCGRWFHVDPRFNRADRSTCSDSCRFQLYRRRQRQALDLYARGWTVKKIARELGSDVDVIKTWIQKGATS
jgi:hypothetical protein